MVRADRKGVGPYGRVALERWRGIPPVGTSHDVTAQKVGRVPPVGTTRHVPINYRGVVIFGNPGGALRVTCRKNRGESCVNFMRLYATLLNLIQPYGNTWHEKTASQTGDGMKWAVMNFSIRDDTRWSNREATLPNALQSVLTVLFRFFGQRRSRLSSEPLKPILEALSAFSDCQRCLPRRA